MPPPSSSSPGLNSNPDNHPIFLVLGVFTGWAFTTFMFFTVLNLGRWLDPRLPLWGCALLTLVWALTGKALQKALR